jgi:hypothetical protein
MFRARPVKSGSRKFPRLGRRCVRREENAVSTTQRHGKDLCDFWRGAFGFDTICLAGIETGYLSHANSLDATRTRMAAAAEQAYAVTAPAAE